MADTTTEQCPKCGCLTTGKKESHGVAGAISGAVAGGMIGNLPRSSNGSCIGRNRRT